ncbi:MAG: tRNA preQ1(34) S-adenosylmethionine ribosyltransferase-isomerase QueA [Deltaproteobacteria bacterium]|nr:tRNA preQ1(34) S-adenosylmethionine ribosyltransferase-isomerase QueA [Deltaproteobacteria bacterium]
MRKPLGANRERGVWGASEASPPPDFLEEPAAQFPPNHLLAPVGLRITKAMRPFLLNDFTYELPQDLIAQEPLAERDKSRLLVRSGAGAMFHRSIAELPEELPSGSVLVLNDSRVFASRLLGTLSDGSSAEVFLLAQPRLQEGGYIAACLAKPMKKIRRSPFIQFPGCVRGVVFSGSPGGGDSGSYLRFDVDSLEGWLARHAYVPLPPYIKRERAIPWESSPDRDRYQTVYAQKKGSVAAPTAGLHFSEHLLDQLKKKGVLIAPVTLHVSAGTFQPVKTIDPSQHQMHCERYCIPPSSWQKIRQAKEDGRPVLAVGTTSFRSVEDFAQRNKEGLCGQWLETNLYIHPRHLEDRYTSSVFDGLLTNFHQPKSTLFMLVCALVGFKEAHVVYREAVERRYRFFSYGDASLFWL